MGYKYAVKEIIKRITIEGEHNYLFLINGGKGKNSTNEPYIEVLPMLNAPH